MQASPPLIALCPSDGLQSKLLSATQAGNLQEFCALVSQGAKIDSDNFSVLHVISGLGFYEMMEHCLQENGKGGICLYNASLSILFVAIQNNKFNMARLLLENHAQFNWKIKSDVLNSFLKHAIVAGDVKAVDFICCTTHSCHTSVSNLEEEGQNCLMLASYSNSEDMLKKICPQSKYSFTSSSIKEIPLWHSLITDNEVSSLFWIRQMAQQNLCEKASQMLIEACLFYRDNQTMAVHSHFSPWSRLNGIVECAPSSVQSLFFEMAQKEGMAHHLPFVQALALKNELKNSLPDKEETTPKKM